MSQRTRDRLCLPEADANTFRIFYTVNDGPAPPLPLRGSAPRPWMYSAW